MKLKAKKIKYETGNKKVILLNHEDAAELGQKAGDRVKIKNAHASNLEDKYWIAIVEIDYSDSLVETGEIGISMDILEEKKNIKETLILSVKPADPPDSFRFIQKKIKGSKLTTEEINNIIRDSVSGSLSKIELAAFITGVSINGMDSEEMTSLTFAEARSGEIFNFGPDVFDKHSTKTHV
jgi:hypothetical protein